MNEIILNCLKARHKLMNVKIVEGFILGEWKGCKAKLKCGRLEDYQVSSENGRAVVRYKGNYIGGLG